ncbi:MAG: response regulator [Desulfobulbaceae bacterium]|uniref:Response regulator n=1 Tax=Candidatus Desulfobia pelagia TaxID=2841692 RepID=A0A8J6NBY0_9BACT|nr:response regulator [Candidatus Desulfobia pelagia]
MNRNSILIVDDEKLIIKSLKINLSREGFDVSTAETVDQALAIIQSKHIDIILSDYLIGSNTGAYLTEKAKEIQPDARIIIFSGHKDPPAIEKTLALGADLFISKPFDLETLLKIIASLHE